MSEQIEEYAANHKFSLVVKISHEEWEILGTAGGVMKQVDNLDDIFLVIYGDNLIELDYAKLMEYASDKEFDALVVLYHEENITQKGMAVLDELWYIQEFIEKPKPEQVVSYWANAGIYIIKKHSFMQHIWHMWFADFGFDFFPKLLARGWKILWYPSRDFMIDIWTFENLAIAQERIRLL